MSHKILTANEQVSVRRNGGTYRTWVNYIVHTRAPGKRPVWQVRAGGHIVRAWVNRSSWAVNCPFCKGSQVIEPGDLFFCVDCLMLGNEGYAMKVWFPKERKMIEKILMYRPDPQTRNWLIGETLDQLRAENVEHKLPTDVDDNRVLFLPAPRKPKSPAASVKE